MTIDSSDYEIRPPVTSGQEPTCDQFGCPFNDLPHAQ